MPNNLVNLLAAGPERSLSNALAACFCRPLSETAASGVEIPSAIRVTRGRREAKKTVSLVAKFPKVRDQGQRGTCVAFASVAFLEFHLSPATKTAGTKRRSEQFVYWACKRDDGAPKEEGTYCSTARQVLKKSGACLAQIWKYNPLPIPKMRVRTSSALRGGEGTLIAVWGCRRGCRQEPRSSPRNAGRPATRRDQRLDVSFLGLPDGRGYGRDYDAAPGRRSGRRPRRLSRRL